MSPGLRQDAHRVMVGFVLRGGHVAEGDSRRLLGLGPLVLTEPDKLVSPFVTRRSRRGIAEEELTMNFRGFLYGWARLLGDVNAVQKGHVGQRVGRRIVGKITGRLLGRLFK